jgi:hypothetical protein
VAGVPAGAVVQIRLSGSVTRAAAVPATLDSLLSGTYTLFINQVVFDGGVYLPVIAEQEVVLAAGSRDTLALAFALAPPTGLPAHPRVWMTPERVEHLKAQMGAGTQRWQRVKSAADAQLAKGTSYGSGDFGYLPVICAAYLATGDQRYADRAAVVLTNYAVPESDLRRDSGYDFRFDMPDVTMGLDWCYTGLPTGVRQQTAGWLMDRADWVWPETNPVIDGGLNRRYAVDRPTNNYWWGFAQTAGAALASLDDDARAAGHVELARAKWADAEARFLGTYGVGGAAVEGSGYDPAWTVARVADAFWTAGQPVSSPWLLASLQWRLHSTMPGCGYQVPLGDQARVSTGPTYSYDRMRVLLMLDAADPSPTLRGQMQYWLDCVGEVAYSENRTAIVTDEFVRYDPDAPTVDFSSLPRSYTAPGMGNVMYRDSWTDRETVAFAFTSGPYVEAHQSAAANALLIWRGSYWVTAGSNIYSHSGIRWESRYHNTMTVGATGGQSRSGSPGGTILTNTVTDALVVLRAQAAAAYSSGVSDYLRTVAYLPDLQTFVVVDRVTASAPFVVRWHSKGAPVIAGDRFTISNPSGDQRCIGTVDGATLGTEPVMLGLGGALSSHAVKLTSPSVSGVVVTVLQCGATAPVAIGRDASGVTATIDGVAVRVPNSEGNPVTR